MKTIIEIALLTLAFVIIGGLFSTLFARTEGKASEELCHTFNTFLTKDWIVKDAEGARAWGLVPQACRVLEVGEVPSKSYSRDKEGAMKQVSDLTSKCWWMFLEGLPNVDILGNQWRLLPGSGLGKDQCFICYTFNLGKDIKFSSQELDNFFDTRSYVVRDDSDQCAALGGGQCALKCEGIFSREVESKKCGAGQKCCTASNKGDECINKGGQCLDRCSDKYAMEYPNWQCAEKRCCVKSENFYTYRDYVQRFGGPGYLAVENSLNFDSSEVYAIFFNEDPKALGYLEKKFQDLVYTRQIDGIVVTKLNNVQELCAIQSGAP